MEKIILETESYQMNGLKDKRFFPFYDLDFNEWVIYENDIPKYYIRLQENPKTESQIANWIANKLKCGNDLRDLIIELGNRSGNHWDIFPSQKGKEIESSYKSEKIELEILTDITIE